MTEIAKIRTKKKTSLLEKHGIKTLAVLSEKDMRTLNALPHATQKAIYEEGLLEGLKGIAHRVTFEEIKADALKMLKTSQNG